MNRYTPSDENRMAVRHFVDNYLGQDGAFVLRLVGHNTNAITVSEFVAALWDKFNEKNKQQTIDDMDEHNL